jgi:glycine cleavage system H protein
MNVPTELKYTQEHEWIRLPEGAGDVVVIGITDHAQDQLGDVVFVEMPEVGLKVDRGATFGTIESVKAVSDLFAPISGEVVEVNQTLADEPEDVNNDPYGDGWMVKLKVSDTAQLKALMSAADYEKHLAEQ